MFQNNEELQLEIDCLASSVTSERGILTTNVNFAPKFASPKKVSWDMCGQNTKIEQLICPILHMGLEHHANQKSR